MLHKNQTERWLYVTIKYQPTHSSPLNCSCKLPTTVKRLSIQKIKIWFQISSSQNSIQCFFIIFTIDFNVS